MEFAFVRNGREEADREKIRTFAEAYGLVPCGELTGANIGEAMAGNYAGEKPKKAVGRPGRAGKLLPERAEEKSDFRPTKQFMTGTEHEH